MHAICEATDTLTGNGGGEMAKFLARGALRVRGSNRALDTAISEIGNL